MICFLGVLTQTGATVHPTDRRRSRSDIWHDSVIMLYKKSPIMRKSKMQKTTALYTAEAKYFSALAAGCEQCEVWLFCTVLVSGKKKPPRSTRTAPHALNGVTTSSARVDVNEPSTFTSGSTSRTKSSKKVKCGWSRFRLCHRWQTS